MTAAIQLRKKPPTAAEKAAKKTALQKRDTMALPGLVAEQQRLLAARDTTMLATPRTSPHGEYLGEPLVPNRLGATDALQVPSLENGQRTAYKPPVAYCVGLSKIFTAGGGAK